MRKILLFAVVLAIRDSEQARSTGAKLRKLSANATFFNTAFRACKGTRILNPVESVRAHAFATRVVNALGVKRMVELAVMAKVPAFALYPLALQSCVLMMIVYSAVPQNGTRKPSRQVQTTFILTTYSMMLSAVRSTQPCLTFRQNDKVFEMSMEIVEYGLKMFIPSILEAGNGYVPLDVNFMLHSMEHLAVLLL